MLRVEWPGDPAASYGIRVQGPAGPEQWFTTSSNSHFQPAATIVGAYCIDVWQTLPASLPAPPSLFSTCAVPGPAPIPSPPPGPGECIGDFGIGTVPCPAEPNQPCGGPFPATVSGLIEAITSTTYNFQCLRVGSNVNVHYDIEGEHAVTHEWAATIAAQFDQAYVDIVGLGFDNAPPTPISVTIIDKGLLTTDGLSLPGRIQMKPRQTEYRDRLVSHELYHQFQWQVVPGPIGNLKWIEGHAEAVACILHSTDSNCTFPTGFADYWSNQTDPADSTGYKNYDSAAFWVWLYGQPGYSKQVIDALKTGPDAPKKLSELLTTPPLTTPCHDGSDCVGVLGTFRESTVAYVPRAAVSTPFSVVWLSGFGGSQAFEAPGQTQILRFTSWAASLRYTIYGCGGVARTGWFRDLPAGVLEVDGKDCLPGDYLLLTNVAAEAGVIVDVSIDRILN